MGNYMLPGTARRSRSVSVSGTAFKLRPHIVMLSAADVGLTVCRNPACSIIPDGGVPGYDDTD